MNTGIMDYGRQLFGFGTSQDVKYHGLLNQGATSYLNSVLQVLFMTKDFREAIERHNPENPDTEFIDCDLKALFDDLKVRSAYTYRITKKLGIDRVYEQRDPAEYFEKILRLTSPEVSQIFHGQLTHRTICSACDKVTDANGPFWHLPLALVDSYKGHYSVAGGIEDFFKASNICGENQLYCEQCDAKADATVKSVLTHHPEVLMLLLKRFVFDYQNMAYFKRNCVVDVPYILQIPENQTYELYAFVEHSGDLRSGHYTATVKSQDDDRWNNFNDTHVTLLSFQPYQVDSSEKSRTAYLLFYRKKTTRVADSCTPELRDGGFPPAISDNYVQCQGVEKIREQGEDEEAAKETGLRDMVSVGRGPHLICSVDDQDNKDDVRQRIPDSEDKRGLLPTETQPEERGENQIFGAAGMDDVRQRTPDINHDFKPRDGDSHGADRLTSKRGTNLRISDLHYHGLQDNVRVGDSKQNRPEEDQRCKQGGSNIYNRHDQEREEQRDVKRDKEQSRGDYEDAQRKGTSRTKPYLSECLENQDKRRSGDVRPNTPDQKINQTVSDSHARHDHRSKQDDMSNDQRRQMADMTDMEAQCLSRVAKQQDHEGFGDMRRIHEHEGGKQEVRQHYDPQLGSLGKKGDEERVGVDVKNDEEGKTGTDRLTSKRGTNLRISDLHYHGLQDNVRVGDSKQNRPEDQRCKQGGSNIYNRHDQEREEWRDVKRDKEQSRVDYEDAQRKRTSRTNPYLSECLENQDKRRSGDVRQNTPDQKISVTHTTHKHVGVEEQTKEQTYARDTQHVENREIILHKERQAGLPGKGRQTEVVRPGSVGKMRQDNSQSKDKTKCKEVAVENSGGSQKSRIYRGMIIDEEIKEMPHGTQRSSQTQPIRIETLGETSQGDIKSRVRPIKTNAKSKSGQKKDPRDTLSKGVDSLQLNEPKKHKRSLESAEEGNTLMDSNTKRMQTGSRAQFKSKKKGADGKKRAWQRLVQQKQLKKKREKEKRSPQCFSCSPLKKQTGQTSESE